MSNIERRSNWVSHMEISPFDCHGNGAGPWLVLESLAVSIHLSSRRRFACIWALGFTGVEAPWGLVSERLLGCMLQMCIELQGAK